MRYAAIPFWLVIPMRVWCLALFVLLPALAWGQETVSPAVFLQGVTALEQHPTDPHAPELRARLIRWVADSAMVNVQVCPGLDPLLSPPTTFGAILFGQAMLGDAAYQLQHPQEDPRAGQAAGLQSLLRTYVAVLHAIPKAHSYFAETLAQQVIQHGNDALFPYTCGRP